MNFMFFLVSIVLLPRTANQFVGHRLNVKSTLKTGENELVLNFGSAFKKVASITVC